MTYSFKKYLIESLILESYKDAERIFSKDNDETTVADYLKKFKRLVDANRVKPEFKDINKWTKRPFDDLIHFVNQLESTPSNKQSKKDVKKNAITLTTFGNWIALIPLSKEASCFYGKGTEWCTAATKSDNYFDNYFDNGITLIYFINKVDGTRYAIAVKKPDEYDGIELQYFDERDNSISSHELAENLDISVSDIRDIIRQSLNVGAVDIARENNKYKPLKAKIDKELSYSIGEGGAYNRYLDIGDLLDNPNLSKVADIRTIEKLKKKRDDNYGQFVRNTMERVMGNLEVIEKTLEKPVDDLASVGIYVQGSFRIFMLSTRALPAGYEKYVKPDEVQKINAAKAKIKEVFNAIDKQQRENNRKYA